MRTTTTKKHALSKRGEEFQEMLRKQFPSKDAYDKAAEEAEKWARAKKTEAQLEEEKRHRIQAQLDEEQEEEERELLDPMWLDFFQKVSDAAELEGRSGMEKVIRKYLRGQSMKRSKDERRDDVVFLKNNEETQELLTDVIKKYLKDQVYDASLEAFERDGPKGLEKFFKKLRMDNEEDVAIINKYLSDQPDETETDTFETTLIEYVTQNVADETAENEDANQEELSEIRLGEEYENLAKVWPAMQLSMNLERLLEKLKDLFYDESEAGKPVEKIYLEDADEDEDEDNESMEGGARRRRASRRSSRRRASRRSSRRRASRRSSRRRASRRSSRRRLSRRLSRRH
jgi:hypothetical protein